MERDQLNDDARAYLESENGGFYEVTLPFFWNNRPKPEVPPHLTVDVVPPESFREAYNDELQDPDSQSIIEEEISRRLGDWLSDGYVCGANTEEINSVDELREAYENDMFTLILG